PVIPDLLRRGSRSRVKRRASASRCPGARCWKVDIQTGGAYAVGRAAIAGRDKYTDSHQGRRPKRLGYRVHLQLGPHLLRSAPTDRKNGRLIDCIVNRGVDALKKAGAGVRREIDDVVGAVRNGTCNLDVQRDFAIWSGWVSRRRVAGAADADRLDLRNLQAKTTKILAQVAQAGAAAQFEDSDSLTFAGDATREAICLRNFDWRIGDPLRKL